MDFFSYEITPSGLTTCPVCGFCDFACDGEVRVCINCGDEKALADLDEDEQS